VLLAVTSLCSRCECQCLQKFKVTKSAAIKGHNRKRLQNQSSDACKLACCKMSWCKTFDYSAGTWSCDLSDKRHCDVSAGLNHVSGWDHYASSEFGVCPYESSTGLTIGAIAVAMLTCCCCMGLMFFMLKLQRDISFKDHYVEPVQRAQVVQGQTIAQQDPVCADDSNIVVGQVVGGPVPGQPVNNTVICRPVYP